MFFPFCIYLSSQLQKHIRISYQCSCWCHTYFYRRIRPLLRNTDLAVLTRSMQRSRVCHCDVLSPFAPGSDIFNAFLGKDNRLFCRSPRPHMTSNTRFTFNFIFLPTVHLFDIKMSCFHSKYPSRFQHPYYVNHKISIIIYSH